MFNPSFIRPNLGALTACVTIHGECFGHQVAPAGPRDSPLSGDSSSAISIGPTRDQTALRGARHECGSVFLIGHHVYHGHDF